MAPFSVNITFSPSAAIANSRPEVIPLFVRGTPIPRRVVDNGIIFTKRIGKLTLAGTINIHHPGLTAVLRTWRRFLDNQCKCQL